MADHLNNEPLSLDRDLDRTILAMVEDLRQRLDIETGLPDAMLAERTGLFVEDVQSRLHVSDGLTEVLQSTYELESRPAQASSGESRSTPAFGSKALSAASTSIREWLNNITWLPRKNRRARRFDTRIRVRSVISRRATAMVLVDQELNSLSFRGKDLERADFSGASLIDADFTEAGLRGAKFENANLLRAVFRGADLRGAFLRRANINGIDICGANMVSATFDLEDLDGVRWDKETQWSRKDLNNLKKMSREEGGVYVASVPPDAMFSGARRSH
jgi:hypothetical protein